MAMRPGRPAMRPPWIGYCSGRNALPTALPGDFLAEQAAVAAVEEQPGLAHGVVVVAEAGAEEVVFEAVVQLADRLGDASRAASALANWKVRS
ncbi:Uncharacterised protein [Pseudomonas aeruginosa]|nr:Uncharacterised protein [Pseudomonas aeruginosa]